MFKPNYKKLLLSAAVSAFCADAALAMQIGELPAAHRSTAATSAKPLNRAHVDALLKQASGQVSVLVRLNADTAPRLATKSLISPEAVANQRNKVEAQQNAFINFAQKAAPGAKVTGRLHNVMNGVFMKVDAKHLAALAANPAVVSIAKVKNYELELANSVPYIGATAVQQMGFTGQGVHVGVLDTGVDYTHARLGGSGQVSDYEAAYANPASRDGMFPTAKIIGGHDFVGETWPNTDASEDDDPIDSRSAENSGGATDGGHGTHVSDSILSVAPDAQLYVVKVCSSVANACNGEAMLKGLDFMADPNGDGDLSDHVDVINMSIGSTFGMAFDDDTSFSVETLSGLGVLVVASAGNSGDSPYISGTPGATPSALSVAAAGNPGDTLPLLAVNGQESKDVGSTHWGGEAEVTETVTLPVQYGDGNGGNLNACAPFPAGSLAGKIVLFDRGACDFTTKLGNLSAGGADISVMAFIDGTLPTGFSPTENTTAMPAYLITKTDGDFIRAQLAAGAVTMTIDPSKSAGSQGDVIAGFSSRGPGNGSNLLKPEITAPGVNIVSAEVGTGDGMTPISGTSFSSPITAGTAALVKGRYPNLSPAELKAFLMNTADNQVFDSPAIFGAATLEPVSRIGAGAVKVNKAIEQTTAAWDKDSLQPALSFGQVDVATTKTLTKTITVRNYGSNSVVYDIANAARYEDKAALDAVNLSMPASVSVPAHGSAQFQVQMTIDSSKLPAWQMDAGYNGNKGSLLTANEFDGYITLTGSDAGAISLPWHVLPRRASDVSVSAALADDAGVLTGKLKNAGETDANLYAYSLIGTSPRRDHGAGMGEQDPVYDLRAVGVSAFEDANDCAEGYGLEFSVNTWNNVVHPYNASFGIEFDLDNDGRPDVKLMTADYGTLINDSSKKGVTAAVIAYPDGNGGFEPYSFSTFTFITDSTNTKNLAFAACAEDVGLTADDVNKGNMITMDATVGDNFFTGFETDRIPGMKYVVGALRYESTINGEAGSVTIPAHEEVAVTVKDTGAAGNSPSDQGVMWVSYSDNTNLILPDAPEEGTVSSKAPSVTAGQHFSTLAEVDAGTVIGSVEAATAEGQPVESFSLVGSTLGTPFAINAAGELSLVNPEGLDPANGHDYTLKVVATADDVRSAVTDVVVTVNHTPSSSAGSAQSVVGTGSVTLRGSATDSDADAMTYRWTQVSGTPVTLSAPTALTTTFTAPDVDDVLTFKLTVTDAMGASSSSTVSVSVTSVSKATGLDSGSGGGGSFGWLGLTLLPLVLRRRNR